MTTKERQVFKKYSKSKMIRLDLDNLRSKQNKKKNRNKNPCHS